MLFAIHFNLDGKMSNVAHLHTIKVLKEDYIEGETKLLMYPYPRENGDHSYYIRALSQDGTVTKRSNYAFLCSNVCDKSKIEEYL